MLQKIKKSFIFLSICRKEISGYKQHYNYYFFNFKDLQNGIIFYPCINMWINIHKASIKTNFPSYSMCARMSNSLLVLKLI